MSSQDSLKILLVKQSMKFKKFLDFSSAKLSQNDFSIN